VVGNIFYTVISVGATCALDAFGQNGGVSDTPYDWSTCFVGNSVYGGRHGAEGFAGAYTVDPYTLNFSGNSLVPRRFRWMDRLELVNIG